MPRLIDADKIGERSKQLMERGCSIIEYAVAIVNEISEAPTVDAERVVRCRECVYKETADFGGDILMGCCHPCGMQDIHDDCFCSYGERKDGDGV